MEQKKKVPQTKGKNGIKPPLMRGFLTQSRRTVLMIKQENEMDELLSYFTGKTIAIIGYDEKGYQHAKTLRNHNIEILVVLREGTSDEHWRNEGFEVVSVWEAVDRAHILQVW